MKTAILIFLTVTILGLTPETGPRAETRHLSASEVIGKVRDTFARVEDYSVRVRVHVDVEGFEFPDQDLALYYKSPDRVQLEGASLGMVPRQAVMADPSQLLDEQKFDIRLEGTESLDGRKTYRLSLFSIEWVAEDGQKSSPDLRAWVDAERWLIVQMEAQAGEVKQGRLTIEHTLVEDTFWLPGHTEVEIFMPGPPARGDSTAISRQPEKGIIELTFHDYAVNVGLPDSLFNSTGMQTE